MQELGERMTDEAHRGFQALAEFHDSRSALSLRRSWHTLFDGFAMFCLASSLFHASPGSEKPGAPRNDR